MSRPLAAGLRWWGRQRLNRPGFWPWLLALALPLAVLLAVSRGAVDIPLDQLPAVFADTDHPLHAALVRVRLPRVVAALEVGAALAVAGALMQTTVRNPLADAGLLGVSAGAGLASVVLLALAPAAAVWLPAVAFGGAAAAMAVLLVLAGLAGPRAGALSLLLAGVALQAILFAGIAVVSFLYAERVPAFVSFTVGSLAQSGWAEVVAVLPALAIGLGVAVLLARRLDLLLFDEQSAASLGLGVGRLRLGVSALAALLTGTAVALAGLVSFVGLLVPNGVRLLVGPSHRRLLVVSALAGALLTLLADLLARTLVAPLELPVGALLAFVGGPYFLFLLFRRVAL
jgi:iron complex transport system permease protein